MTGTPSAQHLAIEFYRSLESRIEGEQGGVPTFADNTHRHVLGQLIALGPDRDWDAVLASSSGPAAAEIAAEWRRLAARLDGLAHGRFRSYRERRGEGHDLGNVRHSEVPDHVMRASQGVERCLAWNGRPLFKTVFDFAMYPMLIQEMRPGALIEIGSGNGASADFLAHAAEAAALTMPVVSVDIRPPDLVRNGVRYLRGDARDLGAVLDDRLLASLPCPWLVIEDAHVAVDAVLAFFDARLLPGDYLVVEDSADKTGPIGALADRRPGRYGVDTRYTDFFGRNATSAVDSVFRVAGP